MRIIEVPSGKKVFDWKVPKEWNVKNAWLIGPEGKKIVDFSKNNLHLVGYSAPVNSKFKFSKIKKHIHTLKKQKNAIPYVTSYYKNHWGFCMPYNTFKKLKNGFKTGSESDINILMEKCRLLIARPENKAKQFFLKIGKISFSKSTGPSCSMVGIWIASSSARAADEKVALTSRARAR